MTNTILYNLSENQIESLDSDELKLLYEYYKSWHKSCMKPNLLTIRWNDGCLCNECIDDQRKYHVNHLLKLRKWMHNYKYGEKE